MDPQKKHVEPSAPREFQAVVLASISDAEGGLFPLTEELPTALLPVANRPLLSFQLELLARSGSFSQVLVLTVEKWLPLLSTWQEQYKGPLLVELLVVPDEAGSADSLRHIRHKLTTDFVLLAGDVISDVPFQRMADQHRLQGAAATVLLRQTPPREAGVVKKARDLDGIDFVGVDDKGTRILSLEAAADTVDSGVFTVSQSLMRAHPHVQMRTDLVDAHVYIFAHWVLDVLDEKPHFSSAKFELLPYLVRKQFLPKGNLPGKSARHGAVDVSDQGAAAGGEGGDAAGEAGAGGAASALAMSAGKGARPDRTSTADDFRCCCYLLPHSGAYCLRAATIKEYMQANLDVSRENRVTLYDRANVQIDPSSVNEGNFVLKSCDRDSTLGEAVEVAGRTVIKKSSIGPHCRIGSGVKITNCVLMDHVVIGDKVNLTNSIVCGNAEVREGASLKDTQVAGGMTIEAGAVHKGEAVAAGGGDEDDDEEEEMP